MSDEHLAPRQCQPLEAWGFEKRKCALCGEEKGGSPYRLCRCQREERGIMDGHQPHFPHGEAPAKTEAQA